MKKLLAILLCLTMLLSLAACGQKAESAAAPNSAEEVDVPVDPEEPTPEPTPEPYRKNPLTGMDTDLPGHRPVAVMLRNSEAALPQWGVSDADLLIEALIQGRTSDLMAVYANVDALEKVGPVAPLNDLMLQLVLPVSAIPVHNGISVYASNLLNLLSYQDLDGTYVGTISFDYDRGRKAEGYNDEFCWYTASNLVANGLDAYGTPDRAELTGLFQFDEKAHPKKMEDTAHCVAIRYGEDSMTTFRYHDDVKQYLMYRNDADEYWDANNDENVYLDNLLLLRASADVKDDEFTRDYDMSSGVGMLFRWGGWQEVLWQKSGATGALLLYDTDGKELSVNTGRWYIGVYGGFEEQDITLYGADGSVQQLPDFI